MQIQSTTSEKSKRLAKNTMMLYFRMLLLMFVSLYTSRINLQALGVDNFGIYGVVGGLVGMFWIVSTGLVSSINRFLTFELGTGNQDKLNKIFGTSIWIQYAIILVVVLIAETIGLWFLNYKMVIPPDRIVAANWVYQFSIASFCLDLIVIPYTATIIAHEKMSAFAYISILTAAGKLIVAWTTLIAPIDHLVWFGAMIFLNGTIIRYIYVFYCRRNFTECRCKIRFDKTVWREMFGFAGWTFIGTVAAILRDYGGNILINIFSGPAVNAARGIATQVNGAVSGFADNFQTALKPQITKSYASGDIPYMTKLVFQGARLSYYILFIFALPILCNPHYILQLWLGEVPAHTVLFVQLVLLLTLNESLSGPIITAMLATGKIKNFQIIVGSINLLNLPISYLVLKLGAIPESVVMVAIGVSVCCTIARVLILSRAIGIASHSFFTKVYIKVVVVSIISAVPPFLLANTVPKDFLSFILTSSVAVTSSAISILYVGSNREERRFLCSKFRNVLDKGKRSYKMVSKCK